MKKGKITRDMTISDVLRMYPGSVEIFFKHGLHCLGCAAAHFENLGEAAEAHGVDADKLVDDLSSWVSKKVK